MASGISVIKDVLYPKLAQLKFHSGCQKSSNLTSGFADSAFSGRSGTATIPGNAKRRSVLWLQRRLSESLFIIYVIWVAVAKVDACTLLRPECFTKFITGLEKPWHGRAIITPVGPRPYDITFRRHPQGYLKGKAHPGENSTHYWSFYQEDQVLKLRFLSFSAEAEERQSIPCDAWSGRWLPPDSEGVPKMVAGANNPPKIYGGSNRCMTF